MSQKTTKSTSLGQCIEFRCLLVFCIVQCYHLFIVGKDLKKKKPLKHLCSYEIVCCR